MIEIGHFTIQNAAEGLARVRHKVGRRVIQLQNENPDAKESYLALKEELKSLGVTAETTYLYVQGHHLHDSIVSPMLTKVCEKLRRERENEIRNKAVHSTQMRNELSCYDHSVENVNSMLKKNLGYMNAAPYLRLKNDIQRYLEKHEINTRQQRDSQPAEEAPLS